MKFEAGYVKEEVSVVNHIRALESRKYAAESKGVEVKSKLRKFGKLKSPTKNSSQISRPRLSFLKKYQNLG